MYEDLKKQMRLRIGNHNPIPYGMAQEAVNAIEDLESEIKRLSRQEEIPIGHVGYDDAQMGREK